MTERLWSGLFRNTGPEFVSAKLEERDRRHARTGDSRYALEPNVKENKGALRDLQTLYWIAKYLYRAAEPEELVEKGVFTTEEATRLQGGVGSSVDRALRAALRRWARAGEAHFRSASRVG